MGTTSSDGTLIESAHDNVGARKRRSGLMTVRSGIFYLSLVLAGVLSVLFLPELLSTLATGWTATGAAELGIHRLHIMGIATVVTIFLLGLFAQAYRPKARVASMWGAFIVITSVTAGTVWYGVGRPEEVIPFFVLTGIALVAHPAGRRLFRRGDSYSPALLGLVALAAVPLLAFISTELGASTGTLDSHGIMGHHVMMVGLAVAPLAYGVFAALGFEGWRLASWLAAVPMGYYGLMSISFPAQSSSAGVLWGSAAIVWALAFVIVAEYSRRSGSDVLRRSR
ncbi:hypothetical protein [Natranaeroarchaeum sulfidigenes]|uniref:Uncharacterized protein n=1 Tax=Natranaeroarchaeum sulfidigenes TaxID=2784880 RepID=A0A897MPD8_9EURY|nr:hypothetical protein [Natranaeroarchaeum sulfidigenes]QSG01828.1 hypothetical protein AArcS_0601 [Natranaeroarchaeum sulfidigenes]